MNGAIAMHERTTPAVHGWDRPGPATASWPLYAVLDLGALLTAPGCGRDWTGAVLREWGLARHVDDAEMLVSELVTNAVLASRHRSGAVVQLHLTSDKDELLVIVHDSGLGEPSPRHADDLSDSGRGLMIVEALSRQSGWYPTLGDTTGKVVWALL
jgi:anti-sigma regulatory factor (Ser/Thr protein kinase)